MSLSKETRDVLKNTIVERVDKVFAALFPGCGIDSTTVGIDEEFLESLIDDHYLGLFTEAEVTEMADYHAKFEDRAKLLEERVETAIGAVVEENHKAIIAKVEAAQ